MGREEAVAKEEEQRGDGDLQCGNEGVHWSTPHRGEDKRCRFRSDPVTRSSRELQGQVKDECGSVQFRQQELHCDHGTVTCRRHGSQ